MSTTDPLHDAFEALARRADLDHVPDRLAGIAHKRRTQRNRRVAVVGGVAALAMIAAGVGLASTTAPTGGDSDGRIATEPTATVTDLGLDVDLRIRPAGGSTYRVSYVVTGTAMPVTDNPTGKVVPQGGIFGTNLTVDGEGFTGSDVGDVSCSTEGPAERYDETFGPLEIPLEAGSHTLEVKVGWCDATGQVRYASDEDTSYYMGESSVADRAKKDLDGDGTPEQLVLVDEGTESALVVEGSVDGRVDLEAEDPTWISGVDDLDGDGSRELLVDVRYRGVSALAVVTVIDGRPAMAKAVLDEPRLFNGVLDGRFYGTMVINGALTTWYGDGDGEEVGPVEGGTLELEGTRLRLVPFAQPMCGATQVSPQPC